MTVATRPGCWIIWMYYISHINQLNLRWIFDQSFFFLVCDEWVFCFFICTCLLSVPVVKYIRCCVCTGHPSFSQDFKLVYLWAIHGSHVTAVCVLSDQLLTEETLNHCLPLPGALYVCQTPRGSRCRVFVEMVFNEAYLHTRGWHFAQHSQSEYIPMSVAQPSLLSPPLFHSLCGWDTLKKKKKKIQLARLF